MKLKTAILEMEYEERLGSVTRCSTFLHHIRTHILLQIFELSEILSKSLCCMLDMIKQIMIVRRIIKDLTIVSIPELNPNSEHS